MFSFSLCIGIQAGEEYGGVGVGWVQAGGGIQAGE